MKHLYAVPLEGTEEEGYTPVYRCPEYKDRLLSCEDFFDGKIQTGWDVFQRGYALSTDSPCFGKRVRREDGTLGEFEFLTYREVERRVQELGSGLLHLNKFTELTVEELNTKVKMLGIYSKNTPEWLICEQVCNAFGLTLVPLYDTLGEESTLYIMDTTELSVVVCDYACSLKLYELFFKTKKKLKLVVVTGVDKLDDKLATCREVTFKTWNEVIYLGSENLLEFQPAAPEAISTVSYTSGVSGIPKGVIITHHQHTSLVLTVNRIVCDVEKGGVENPKVHLSYLPLSHMYERLYIAASLIEGSRVGVFSGDVKNILEDIKALCPNVFPSVPRLYMRIHDRVRSAVAQKSFIVRGLFAMGLNSKLKRIKKTGDVTHKFWDKLLFKKFNRLLGGGVEWMLTGSAPLSPKVFDNIRALFSIPLISVSAAHAQGYGLTETCAGAFSTKKGEADSSVVGGPVPTMEFRLKSLPDFNYYVTDKYPR